MNDSTKKWYKKAKKKCQKWNGKYESGKIDYIRYMEEMTEIAEYYILACDFDLPAFDCDPEQRFEEKDNETE